MPPETNDQQAPSPSPTTSPADPVQQAMASLAAAGPTPDQVRQSPEFLALAEQNRNLARQAGQSRQEAERLRQETEAQRQAAEAQRAAAIQQQLQATLGDQAPAFATLAQLLQTDPVAAAQQFAQMTRVQSTATPSVPQGQPAQPVDSHAAAPPPAVPSMSQVAGISASAPLGAPPQRTDEERAAEYRARFEKTVADNRNLQTRTRIRARERAEALGNYLKSALLSQHGVDPDLYFRQER